MKIIFSIGDCNGVGIEVMLKAIAAFDKKKSNLKNIFAVSGNSNLIKNYIKQIQFPAKIENNFLIVNQRRIQIIETPSTSKIDFGKISKQAGLCALESIENAVSQVIKKQFDAIVTMPISKFSLHEAGSNFPGHTEMIASKCNSDFPLMVLCDNKIRVALATIHEPIIKISELINKSSLTKTISAFHKSLQLDFGIANPRIAILGLNPHAGENGWIGKEEQKIISPTIEKLNSNGYNLAGPMPADGFFGFAEYKNYDGILAMYHDQGLIPLKMLTQGNGVNFTANLPIIRTSPDHGTAFSIAGKNIANPQSTLNAIEMAIQIHKNRISFK